MAQKPKKLNWEAFITSLDMDAEVESASREMEEMTSRDIYNLGSFTNIGRYLVDRPSNHAMHGTEVNYSVDPVSVIKNTLIEGRAYYKVEDVEHIDFDPFIRDAEVDYFSNKINRLLICYPVEDDGKILYYWESYTRLEDGSCEYIRYHLTDTDEDKEIENLTPQDTTTLRDIPYVCAVWNEGMSILDTVRASIIRLEIVTRVVGEENMDNRVRYIVGGDDVSKIGSAPRRWGRPFRIMPTNSSIENASSDKAALDLLIHEQADLWNNIEKATGVVSTEKLASLSGVSRLIAEKPLVMLCEDLRAVFVKFLEDIYALVSWMGIEEPECSFKSMSVAPMCEDPVKFMDALDRALDREAIDIEEWQKKARWALDLMRK